MDTEDLVLFSLLVPFMCFLAASVVSLVHGHPVASVLFALASILAIPEYHGQIK